MNGIPSSKGLNLFLRQEHVLTKFQLSGDLHDSSENRDDEDTPPPPTPPSSHDPVSSPEIELPEQSYSAALDESGLGIDNFMPMRDDEASTTQVANASDPSDMYLMGHNDIFSNYNTHNNEISIFESGSLSFSPKSTIPFSLSLPQMNSAAYQDVTERGALLLKGQDCQLRRTNSAFSDHISVLEYFLQKKWEASGGLSNYQDTG